MGLTNRVLQNANKRKAYDTGYTAKMIYFSLAVLLGIYVGINISGLFQSNNNETLAFLGPPNNNFLGDDRIMRQQLKEAQTLIQHLKAQAEELLNDESKARRHPEKEIDTPIGSPSFRSVSATSSQNLHPFCQQVLPHPAPTAMALWNEHILKVLASTRVPNDRRFMFHDFTSQILQIMSPRLHRSVKTTINDWRPVESCLTIAWERYKYLQLPAKERRAIPFNDKPRPLKILIMGGSLLVGTNCRMLMKELNFQFQLPKRECNWSNRVGWFLNSFFLGETTNNNNELLVEVTKVAMGGTNTATGAIIWQYDLIPENARDPDVVINAYSTNDMHILTMLEAESSNTTLRDRTFEMMQEFVRKILNTKRCGGEYSNGKENVMNTPIPPLLLHMDDYLGNEQRTIWETTELTQGAQVLANYYGFVSMSYADTIRTLVYGDAYEKWFSSEWFVEDKRKKTVTFERQIHPGMGAHISSMWVTVYNLLNLASMYCSMPNPNGMKNISEYEPDLWGLPELKKEYKEPEGKPQQNPIGLPPELTKDLLLEDITSLWIHSANENQQMQLGNKCADINTLHQSQRTSSLTQLKCPFSWVSGLSLQQNNVTWIQEYFRIQSSTWEGWKLSEDGGKIGFIPSTTTPANGNNSSHVFVLDFSYSQTIRSITFFFMKSYGAKWKSSEVETKVWSSNNEVLEERHMFGTHNKTTSEMYTEEIILTKPVDAGESFQIEIKLVGGETFKIMGLAVCS